jgi:hypothetical protein
MKQIYFLASILFLNCINLNAQTVVNPVSATTSFTPAFGTNLLFSYNGTGLITPNSLTSNHDLTSTINSFLANETTGTIDFNLGAIHTIDGISFWNQNMGGPSNQAGINGVKFYASLDGTTYNLITGAPNTFTMVTTGISAPETFTFTPVAAAYIRMEVTSNHGFAKTGFAEIAFAEGTPLSTSNFSENISIKVFPNPSEYYIMISGLTYPEKYTVYNILGKKVLNGTISENGKIEINNLQSGLYFVQLNNTTTLKFIKK